MQYLRDSNCAASNLLLMPHMQMSSHAFLESKAEWPDVAALYREAECPPEAIVDRHDLGKGMRWALAIEATAALSVYAIFHFCHLLF